MSDVGEVFSMRLSLVNRMQDYNIDPREKSHTPSHLNDACLAD
jgi:hypothetical protein